MVDEEAQRIRDEVIRAMAEQGEDVEALGLDTSADAETEGAPVAMPAWEHVAEVAAEAGQDEASGETAMSDEEVERLFLAAVFEDVRAHSGDGKLVQPAHWLDAGLVPAHFAADDWEMFVYEYLEERKGERDERVAAASAAPVRTATRAVGVPRMLRVEEEPEPEDAAASEVTEPEDPERDGGARANSAPDDAPDALPCGDIVALVGKHSYYLYSTERMTDAYARWAFLASEDDRVLTFVECVRDESRKYPRPMEASSLSNEPFSLSADEIDELWRTVRDSGAYPDLDTVTASNGDVYYFSTEYLTPTYAASLAEWNSVERDMFL
ncbi:hypothetical protein [Eggerthella timonensis]|uniref:hypothetical protein n=1 Tax=Eggerthella timonensis TaxID=1871008 RepID=UPI000C788812|nr:hypothetical protein [Eggerthella timonensis]